MIDLNGSANRKKVSVDVESVGVYSVYRKFEHGCSRDWYGSHGVSGAAWYGCGIYEEI